jgi:tripartite motif-containing protein 45
VENKQGGFDSGHSKNRDQEVSPSPPSLPVCRHFNASENNNFFCENCFICLCHDCKESKHSDHQLVTMKDMNIHCFEKLQNLLSKTQPLVLTLKESIRTIEILVHKIDEKAARIGDGICHVIDTHIASLEEHKVALLTELNQIKNSKIRLLSHQLMSLTEALESIHATCSQTSQILSPSKKYSNSISVKLSLATKLEEMTEARYEYRPQTDDYIHFIPQASAGYRKGYKMHGMLDTQTPSPANSYISEETFHIAKQRRQVSFQLIVVDKSGVRKLIGGDHVECRVQAPSGSQIKTDVIDDDDGSYEIVFTPDSPGDHRISVLLSTKHVRGSPFIINVMPRRKHKGRFHCCSFCSTEGKMKFPCACGAIMPGEGENSGCGHGHIGHPGCSHWSCCGSTEENSDCVI